MTSRVHLHMIKRVKQVLGPGVLIANGSKVCQKLNTQHSSSCPMASAEFLKARDFLLAHRTDFEWAWHRFRWPVLDEFNWALDGHGQHWDGAAGTTRRRRRDPAEFRRTIRALQSGRQISCAGSAFGEAPAEESIEVTCGTRIPSSAQLSLY
jgi:hypothetical protein